MRLSKEDSVLVVIDMKERLLRHMKDSEQVLSNTKILIQGAKVLGIPVVFTQQYTRGLGETVTDIREIPELFKYVEKNIF